MVPPPPDLNLVERKVAAATGLSISSFDALRHLGATDSLLTMAALANLGLHSRTRVSRVVDELARAGLVSRQPNPEDGRSSFVTLTALGRTALKKAEHLYRTTVDEEFSAHLSPSNLENLFVALDALQSSLKYSSH